MSEFKTETPSLSFFPKINKQTQEPEREKEKNVSGEEEEPKLSSDKWV